MSTKKEKPVLFPTLFPDQLKGWMEKEKAEGRKGSQYEFARQVGVPNHYVTDWKTGRHGIPYKYLNSICDVLGLSKDVYYPSSHGERYQYSREYMTEVGEKKMIPFCEEIGLDVDFIYMIRKLIGSDFNDQFPFWTPIIRTFEVNGKQTDRIQIRSPKDMDPFAPTLVYRHSDHFADSAQMKNTEVPVPLCETFQTEVLVEEEGKEERRLITMCQADLEFLYDVQEDVKDYIEFLFLKRKKEMKREGEEATKESIISLPNGGVAIRPLKAEALNKIDRYFDGYVDSKEEADQKNNR